MDGLIVAVAVSLEPINNTLSRLAVMLFVVSTIVWLAFLVIGRRICQRALRPVTRMSEQAGRMNEQRMNERLVVPEADDELRSLGVSFNGLLTRLQEAFERNRQFAGNASHQLRTPLAAIMGQVEVSLRHPRSAEEYRDTLVKVKNGGLQLRQIIESLLFLTRADREGLAAGFEPLDVSVWIETWRQQRDYLPRIHDLKIIRPDLPCWVRAQPALLAQMIDNLVDNASKYSPERTPILLQVIRLSKQVSISVENHAKGIPAEEIGYVFDPFFRSEDSRRSSIPGVGLGLAVVRRIAEAFQAEVRVESILNKTTKFEILLPRVPDEYSSKEARQDVLPALEEKVVSA
jgi:signal transduction histidine kinase